MDIESKLLDALRRIGRRYSYPTTKARRSRAILEMHGVSIAADELGCGEEIEKRISTVVHDYIDTDTAKRQQISKAS